MRNALCPGSPCNRCARNAKHKTCLYIAPDKTRINGCAAWYDWAVQAWDNIHRQGIETIRKKQELEE